MEIKKDRFMKARGGKAKIIDVLCAKCNSQVLVYQKDGPGFLHRCYLNRILEPEEYAKLQHKSDINLKSMPNLICKNCKTVIGSPMQHTDWRLAFRLRPGFYAKKQHN